MAISQQLKFLGHILREEKDKPTNIHGNQKAFKVHPRPKNYTRPEQ